MVYNNLFNEKKMEEFIELYDSNLVINSPNEDPVCDWIKKLNNNELEDEKKNYANFLVIILERLLGYKIEDIAYETDPGSEGRPVEFTFKKGEKEYVVVELKGTKTKDLNKRYNRSQSAIEQVTNYASIKEETQWAFVSNYNEFRLFNPNYREKYISFKFKSLTDPEVLKKFLLIFSKFSLIEEDIPQTLLRETRIIERELEDEFYQLFSETRLMLIKELEYSSEDIDRVEAIRLAQLILNRYIFICFAEDLKLIPSETTADVLITPIEKKNLFEFTMWNRLNELFRFMDKGNGARGIGSFNGGLFKENLKNLEIRDFIEDLHFYDDCYKNWKFEEKYDEMTNLLGEYKDTLNPIYKNLLIISSFDFESELSVNILGHIFENSIGDIEELKDQTKERRKKDGVFYTPEYITDYICRNTIIPYLSNSGEVSTVHELISEYEQENNLDELDKRLKEIKIVDPACGSGAFLNKAVDVLFEIHEALHDSMYADDTSLDQYFDSLESRRQIISNNIYGVDLNEESVEITKLSLFLKLATNTGITKGFQLPNLDKNIKCGNSIINDFKTVGEKSFDWEKEFCEVFKTGGFDIIIGNPPYITPSLGKKQKTLSDLEIDFLSKNFESYEYKGNTYVLFMEQGLTLLKKGGILGYIIPNTLLTNYYYKKLRKILLKNTKILQLIEILGVIFNDAETGGNLISIIQKDEFNETNIIKSVSFKDPDFLNNINLDKFNLINQSNFSEFEDNKFLIDLSKLNLIMKLKDKGVLLGNSDYFIIYQGIVTGNNNKFISNTPETQRHEKLLRGADIYRYSKHFNNNFILFDKEELYSNTNEEMFLVPEKLISRQTSDRIVATYDNQQYFTLDSTHVLISKKINTKFFLAIYNSKLINFFYQTIVPEIGKTFAQVKTVNLNQLPIIIPNEKEDIVIGLVDQLLVLNDSLIDLQYNFREWLNLEYKVGDISSRNKLFYFWNLSEEDFFSILKQKLKKISVTDYSNIKKSFNDIKYEITNLIFEINQLEVELNNIIYELYELTEEEINIIEESLK
ncbi:Eco57I restriction-modification methylase domain-containing protein [Methanobrevibacter ruminantium]|uniref:Eco57I restriction-modification methylase domain-containing protein n=1 Tax=Methanobrevibacter ruminantium TaxID=83816 RepID=UPI003F0ECFE5